MRIAKIAGVLVVVGIVIQFIPVNQTNPPITAPLTAPADVQAVLDRACMDCHSNATKWPWYSKIAPGAWLIAYDVNEGREHLNFSEFTSMSAKDQKHAFEEIIEVIDEGEMPPPVYTPLHPEARLTDADKALVVAWAQDMLMPKYAAPAPVTEAPGAITGDAATADDTDHSGHEGHEGHGGH